MPLSGARPQRLQPRRPRPATFQSSLQVLQDIGKDLAHRVPAGGASDAAARMRAGAAQVQSSDWSAILRAAEHRPHGEQLVERLLAMEDMAARKAVSRFEAVR